jgi:hypothetical protein
VPLEPPRPDDPTPDPDPTTRDGDDALPDRRDPDLAGEDGPGADLVRDREPAEPNEPA